MHKENRIILKMKTVLVCCGTMDVQGTKVRNTGNFLSETIQTEGSGRASLKYRKAKQIFLKRKVKK